MDIVSDSLAQITETARRNFLLRSTAIYAMLFFCYSASFAQTEQAPSLSDKIIALHDKILEDGKTTTQLTEKDLASLPIGIVKDVGGIDYMIIIDSARFTPQGAFFNAYMTLDFKATGKMISFIGRNIGFHPGGIASSTNSRLVLASEEKIPINNKVNLFLKADGRNFVEFDCNGFKSVNIKGFFEFERDFLIPENPDGTLNTTGKVTATFEVNSTDWGSLMATINMSPFQVPNAKGLSFTVRDAVMDFSDVANPPNFQFPKDYLSGLGGNSNLWQGFFLREASVKIYKELESTRGRKEVVVRNVIIDNMGVSGALDVKNVFGREEGSMNGWPFSIDSLGIVVVKNQLKGGGLRGLMNIPLFDSTDPIRYSASISDNNGDTDYLFSIQPGKSLKASVLAAEVELLPNSTIIIAKTNGLLRGEAILNGFISVKSAEKLDLKKLKFTNFHIASDAPYIRSGVFSFAGTEPQKAATYPLVINGLDFIFNANDIKLNVTGSLGLMSSTDKGFAATATMGITGEIKQIQETVGDVIVKRQEWKYKDTHFSDIYVKVNGGAYSIDGRLTLYDKDPTYGNGFRGEVNATFTPGLALKVIAQFGNVNDTRYWYVDGMLKIPGAPIPIGPGFGFYGFGGGAYYHMSLQQANINSPQNFVTKTGTSDKLTVGDTRSGARYVPDSNTGLGLKATVIVGTTPEQPFNGDATFEMSFNSTGGLRMIRFQGQGFFMTSISYPRNTAAPLYANLEMLYDFNNHALHANLDTYVNIGDVIKGIHPRGLAGSAVMHFAPDAWYIHIGTPQQKIGLNFIGLVQTGAYFMVGTYIPGMPPPPQNVSDILGGMDLDFMRNENALASGGGFAFGASLEVRTPRIEILIFYGQFSAGLGFDVMLKNYGSAKCVGSSGPIGINGWYASGQAWAYFQGSIGVFVDLTFIKGEFEILRIGAAAVLQAKLPNPFWMQGVVGGYFSVLGGLVKGSCRFKITIGEQCEIEGVSSVAGIKVISGIKPEASDGEVDVFTAPQAAFNVSVDKEFEMMDLNNNYKAYRVRLDYVKVTSNGKDIAGTLQWNENKDVVIFNPSEILPPKSKVKAEVKVTWEQRVNGAWKAISSNGRNEGEIVATEFNTGVAPDFIPESNVLYSYPITAQYNFMKNEYPQGYMKLKVGQAYLFEKTEGAQTYDFVARFTPAGQPASMNATLAYEAGLIRYNMPSNLPNDKMMTINFMKVPLSTQQAVDKNVTTGDRQLTATDAGNVSTTSREIQGTVTRVEEKKLYGSFLKTSKFNTFTEKLNSITGYRVVGRVIPGLNVYEPGAWANLTEIFDKVETSGIGNYEPLIQIDALPDNPWYTDHINPLVYQLYPVSNKMTITWRQPTAGIPPLKGVSISQDRVLSMSEEDMYSSSTPQTGGRISFVYSLSFYAYKDFYELRQKAYDSYMNAGYSSVPEGARRLMTTPYYDVVNGRYRFNLSYKLPGLNTITTSQTFNIDW